MGKMGKKRSTEATITVAASAPSSEPCARGEASEQEGEPPGSSPGPTRRRNRKRTGAQTVTDVSATETRPPTAVEASQYSSVPPSVHVLYLRPTEPEFVALDSSVAALAARFAGTVRITVIGEEELPPSLSDYARRQTPTLLVLRDGRLVGEALGAPPLRELISMLTCAVLWPTPEPAPAAPVAAPMASIATER